VSLVAGSATCTTSTLSVASHSIAVTYSGDASIAGSNATVAQVVNKKTTTVMLSATPNPVDPGAPVTLTATVAGDPPSGTVTFTDNGATLACSPVTLVPGATSSTATCIVTFATAGSYSIVATYSGDASFAAAASTALAVSVGTAVAAPLLDRWAMLMLAGLLGAAAFMRRRKLS
jgi:hypothetical protein